MRTDTSNKPVDVCIVRTGIANLASVAAGLRRAGASVHLTEGPGEIEAAQAVVLPGVGAFGAGMETLRRNELVDALRERIGAGKPTMAVCVGLQLLLEASEESPGVAGLGVVPATAERFVGNVRVPQLGWNLVEPQANCKLIERGHAYFANSYRLQRPPEGWTCAMTDHGGPFVSAMERGAVLACQFHPELSARWGLALLRRWLDAARGAAC